MVCLANPKQKASVMGDSVCAVKRRTAVPSCPVRVCFRVCDEPQVTLDWKRTVLEAVIGHIEVEMDACS